MKGMTALSYLIIVFSLSGCVSNYEYLTVGQVMTVDEEERKALLYWRKDEGRLWYGKKYEQLDQTPVMRVCGESTYPFAVTDDGIMQIDSGANDYRFATTDKRGDIILLQEPQRLRDGSQCGVVLLEGEVVGTESLRENALPRVAFICKNPIRPNRYPAVGSYLFSPVVREKTDISRAAPACEDIYD